MENVLLDKLKLGQSDPLDMIIEKYSPYVYTVVRNFSAGALSEEDMEEIVSDAFVLLWKNRSRIQSDKPLTPYLAAIARNCVKNKLRSISKAVCENGEYEPVCDDLTEQFENELILECIWQALDKLDPRSRELFIRYCLYGEKLSLIAEKMGISDSNAKTTLHRARKRIKKYLTERGFDQYEERK